MKFDTNNIKTYPKKGDTMRMKCFYLSDVPYTTIVVTKDYVHKESESSGVVHSYVSYLPNGFVFTTNEFPHASAQSHHHEFKYSKIVLLERLKRVSPMSERIDSVI
jgi:hypothetical protein